MGAVTRATVSATTPAVDQVDSVNTPAGYPVTPIYPGAIDPAEYAGPGELTKAQTLAGEPMPGQMFASPVPAEMAPGGGWEDTSWQTGHGAPQAAWDSLAGAPFAPSGAIAQADTHGVDTGGTFVHEHVTPPAIGTLTRRTQTGQTMNDTYAYEPVNGQRVSVPNDRVDLDQYQTADSHAYAPYDVPYGERPLLQNLAYEAAPYAGVGVYSPAGGLPDTSLHDGGSTVYEQPPAPTATVAAPQPAPAGGGGWVLG